MDGMKGYDAWLAEPAERTDEDPRCRVCDGPVQDGNDMTCSDECEARR